MCDYVAARIIYCSSCNQGQTYTHNYCYACGHKLEKQEENKNVYTLNLSTDMLNRMKDTKILTTKTKYKRHDLIKIIENHEKGQSYTKMIAEVQEKDMNEMSSMLWDHKLEIIYFVIVKD